MPTVERNAATINQSIRMRFRFAFDRTGNLFDPDSITSVVIKQTDDTVLETITGANIIKSSTGRYYVDTSASWNTSSQTVIDEWTIVRLGTTYTLQGHTFIRSTSSPSIGMQSFVDLVKLKVQDNSDILTDPDDYETKINDAVKEYSKRRPYIQATQLTGDGEREVNVPSDWEENFSFVQDIEYPLDQFPPEYLESKWYRVEYMPSGLQIRFVYTQYPADGEDYILRYATLHSVTDATTTIPDSHKDALCCLAASKCCEAIATYYGNTKDPTVDADAVSYRTRGDEFAARGRELFKEYDRQVKSRVTGLIGEHDMQAYWDGTDEYLLKSDRLI